MAEQIGAMYVTIDGVDKISAKLKEIEGRLGKINKKTGDIDISNKNFEYVREKFADLSKYYARLQDQMNERLNLKLKTDDVQREMDSVMNAVRKLYDLISTPVNGTDFINRPFESIKANAKLGVSAVEGVKDIIDNYTKTVLGSARATASLQQEIDRLGSKNGKALTANSAKEEANLISKNRLVEGLTVAYNRLGYAMQDIGRKMVGVHGNDFLMASGNGLLQRIEKYRDAIGIALEGAKAGNYKRSDAIQLLGSSYIDLYDKRSQFGKSVGMYQSDQKVADRMTESYAKAQVEIGRIVASIEKDIAKLGTASKFKGLNLTDTANITNQKKALEDLIAKWEQFGADKSKATNRTSVANMQALSNEIRKEAAAVYDSAKAHNANAIAREKEAQRIAKETQNTAIAQNSVQRYIDKANTLKGVLENLSQTRSLHMNVFGDVQTQISNLEQLVNTLKQFKAATDDVTNKKLFSDARLLYSQIMREAGVTKGYAFRDANQVEKDKREAERQAKETERQALNISKSYNSAVNSAKKKLQELTHLRQQLSEKIGAASKAGSDTSEMQRQMRVLLLMMKEYRAVINSIGKAAFANPLNNIMANLGLQYGNVRHDVAKAMKGVNLAEIGKAQSAMAQANIEQAKFMAGMSEIGSSTSWLGSRFQELKGLIATTFTVDALRNFLTSIVQIGGQLENQRISIGAILGNKSHANDLFDQIKDLATRSPFGVLQLDQYTKSLTAYGFKYNELFETVKKFADISAGAGVDMNRLTLAIGHVKAETALTGITLRQFTMANIPMLEMLAERYTELEKRMVSVAEVRKRISKKQVSYEDVMGVIDDMTNEGGRFYNMQEVLADSVKSKWKNLGDQMDIMYGEMAEGGPGKALKWLAETLMGIAKNWESVGKTMLTVIGLFGIFRTAMRAMNGGAVTSSVIGKISATNDATRANLRFAQSYRELSAEESKLLADDSRLMVSTLRLMASQGELNVELLKRLVALKKITVEDAKVVAAELGVAGAEREVAAAVYKTNASFSMFKARIKEAGISVFGFAKAWGPFIAISAAIEGMMYLWDKHEKVIERQKKVAEDASEAYTKLSEKVSQASDGTGHPSPLDTQGMESAIEGMLDTLREYGADTDDLLGGIFKTNDVEGHKEYVKDLKTRYEELYDVLVQVRDVTGEIHAKGNVFSDAEEETGGWLGMNDTIGENIVDATEAYKNFAKEVDKTDVSGFVIPLARLREEFKEFDEMVKTVDKETGKSLEGNIAAQLKLLYSGSGPLYEKMRTALYRIDRDSYMVFDKMSRNYLLKLSDMVDDTEKFADVIKNKMNNAGLGKIDWKHLTKEQQAYLDKSYRDWIKTFGDVSKGVEDELLRVLDKKYDIKITARVQWQQEDVEAVWQQTGKQLAGGSADVLNAFGSTKNLRSSLEAVKKVYDDAKKDLEQYNKTLGMSGENETDMSVIDQDLQAKRNQAIKDIKAARDIARQFNYDLDEKKSKKTGNGRKEDKDLKRWKTEFDLLKQVNSEYKKYVELYGREVAMRKLRENGEFGALERGDILGKDFDLSDYAGNSKKFLEYIKKQSLNTEERKKFAQSVQKNDLDQQVEWNKELAEAAAKRVQREIDIERRKWEMFEQMRSRYGDAYAEDVIGLERRRRNKNDYTDSEVIAWGGGNKALERRDVLVRLLGGTKAVNGEIPGLKKIMEATDKELEDLFGNEKYDAQGVYAALKELREIEEKIRKDAVDATFAVRDKLKSTADEIARINANRNDMLRKLGANGSSREQEVINAEADSKILKLSARYMQFMNNTSMMNRLEKLIFGGDVKNDIERRHNAGLMSDTEYAKEYAEWLRKSRDRRNISSMDDAINFGYKNLESLKGILEEYKKSGDKTGIDQTTKRIESTEKYLKFLDASNNGLKKSATVFDAINKVASPVIDLFEALGENGLSDIMNMGSSALGAASATANGLSALGLESAGPYGAAAAAALSVTASLIRMHDAALEKEIQASKARQKHDEWYLSRLKSITNDQMGGMYGNTGNASVMDKMDKLYNTGHNGLLSDFFKGSDILSEKTREALENARSTGELYDGMYASLLAKQDELNSQIDAERDKKNSDDDVIRGYEEQLDEVKDEIRDLSKEIANELYGIDFKSWANDFGSALVSAWEKGTSGVKAYRDAVSDVLKETMVSVIQQKYIQKMIEPLMNDFLDQFEADNGKITYDGWKILEQLYSLGVEAAEVTNAAMDAVESTVREHGGTLKNKNTGLSPSIAGVTEDTADLLSSYINSIRADVSAQRLTVDGIAVDVKTIADAVTGTAGAAVEPKSAAVDYGYASLARMADEQMPIIANSIAVMVADLKAVEMNTRRGADATEEIVGVLNMLTNGSGARRLSVDMG